MAYAVRSTIESYLSSTNNKFFKDGNYWCGMMDDGIGKFGQHSATLGQHSAYLAGNFQAAEKCRAAANGFGSFRDGFGAFRVIFPIQKLVTGQMFLQTDPEGWRRVKHKDGKPVQIPTSDLGTVWKKENGLWKNVAGEISADGKYIDDINGKRVSRDWLDVIMDIFVLIARILSPMRWLHNLKAIDLGKHAKWMGGVVMGCWGMVLSIGFVQSIRDLIAEVDLQAIQKRIWDAFQAFIDLIALVFDFGVGSAHPVLSIIGSGLNIVSATSLMVKEAVYYS